MNPLLTFYFCVLIYLFIPDEKMRHKAMMFLSFMQNLNPSLLSIFTIIYFNIAIYKF